MNIFSKRFEFIYLITLSIIFIVMSIGAIFSESRIFDEGLHVTAGHRFITNADFASEPFNPPLPRELVALPSIFIPSSLNDPIYFWQRIVVVFVSCVFLISIYTVVRKLFGKVPAMFSVLLYAFNPELFAHSHYAVTDLILAFFIFLSLMLYILWKDNFTNTKRICWGICIGLALSSKVSALPFLLISFIIIFLINIVLKKPLERIIIRKMLLHFTIVIITTMITLWGTYFFTNESIMGKGFTPNNGIVKKLVSVPGVMYILSEPVPLGGYLRTVKQVLLYNYSDLYSKPAFLLGQVSSSGRWYFYPIAFIVKTPIPLLVLLLLSIIFIKRFSLRVLLIPVGAIIVCSMISTLNLGIRYILPVYPLLIVYVSQIVKPQIMFRYKYALLIFLIAWYVSGTLTVYPHTLSYMNELSGSANARYRVLLDSNYDWGQGLVALAQYQKTHSDEKLQLAYFGMVDPTSYGLEYERIGDVSLGDKKSSVQVKTTNGYTTAISASCYYFCEYYKQSPFNNKSPDQVIGGSILLFRW